MIVFVSVFSMVWYEIVTQHFVVVYRRIYQCILISCIPIKKLEATCRVFNGIPLESVALVVFILTALSL